MKQQIKVGFVGSRGITDQKAANKILDLVKNLYEIETVISGGCKDSPDKLGINWARYNQIPFFEFNAEWEKYGKKAGIIRNGNVINNVNFLIAMWDGRSPGTKNTIDRADSKNMPCIIIQPIQNIAFDVDSIENIYCIIKLTDTHHYDFKKAMFVSRNGDIQLEAEPDVMHTYDVCYVVYFNNID